MDENQPVKEPPTPSTLFLSFLLLGATAFGGPAMVEYIRRLAVEEKGWLDEASFREGVALCTTIPGATAIQVAGYVGFRAGGVRGATLAFTGFALPAFLLMMILSAFYLAVMGNPMAASAFTGLKVLVVAIVGAAAVSFSRGTLSGIRPLVIAGTAAGLFLAGISPVLIILLSALLGVLLVTPLPVPEGDGGLPPAPAPWAVVAIIAGALGFLLLLLLFAPLLAGIFSLMAGIDLLAFGGGQAALPLLYHEVVQVRGWLDAPTFLDGVALGQVTPGPIVISATFIGYLVAGPLGGLVATLGIFLPSFLLVVGTAPYFPRLRGIPALSRAFGGILSSFAGLLFSVTILFATRISWTLPLAAMALGAFAALVYGVKIYWVVLAGLLLSLLFL
jgi:chromate transporter